MAVGAARLAIRAPPGAAVRTRALAEDALRLASAGDDPRMVVVRRLALGRVPVSARAEDWQALANARLQAMTSQAVHAATPGAAAAEAVWFSSPQEAMVLLLAEMAAGRTPLAWFWRLVLPDWRGAPLGVWLPRLLADGPRLPERLAAVSRALAVAAQHGRLAPMVAALPDNAVALPTAPAPTADGETPTPTSSPPRPTDLASVTTLLARLTSTVRPALLHALASLPAGAGRAWQLARLVLVAAAPELAALPAVLDAMAHVLASREFDRVMLTAPAAAVPRPAETPPKRSARDDRPLPPAPVRSAPQARPSDAITTPDEIGQNTPEAIVEPPPSIAEAGSAVAGLWLLVRPLAHLGLPDWLLERPELAAAGFGRALLAHIARRQRTPVEDPVFVLLGDTAPVDPTLLIAWRVGLDRWLRRRTQRNLATIVRRRGWLSGDASAITVRFRLDQADIALRRRALDVDPGWTDWLGLAVAYQFRDHPFP